MLADFKIRKMFRPLIGIQVEEQQPDNEPSKDTSEEPSNKPATKVFSGGANGEVEVPVKPERVVLLAPNYAGYTLALGVKPIGVPEFTFGNPYLQEMLEGVENLGANAAIEPALEQIAALNPDLIIGLDALKDVEQLEKIAPVVIFPVTKNNKEVMRELGKLLEREEEAKRWEEQWDSKIRDYRALLDSELSDKTFSIMYPSDKGVYTFREGYGRGTEIIYGDFGLKMPEAAKSIFEEGKGFSIVSLEILPEVAGDYIFHAPWLGNADGAASIYDSNIWKSIPAVAEGRAFAVDYNVFTFSDPYSWEGQLEIISDLLLGKLAN